MGNTHNVFFAIPVEVGDFHAVNFTGKRGDGVVFEVGAITEDADAVVIAVGARAGILNADIAAAARTTVEGGAAAVGNTATGCIRRGAGGGAAGRTANVGRFFAAHLPRRTGSAIQGSSTAIGDAATIGTRQGTGGGFANTGVVTAGFARRARATVQITVAAI